MRAFHCLPRIGVILTCYKDVLLITQLKRGYIYIRYPYWGKLWTMMMDQSVSWCLRIGCEGKWLCGQSNRMMEKDKKYDYQL